MAIFKLIDDGTYRVEGEITEEDVEKINKFQIRTCLILQNTKGQSSEIIGKINTDNVYFSVLGGLDYFEKEKYNNKGYIERTYSAPKGLAKVLQYFEGIEAGMNPQWTDMQKCMYAYSALAEDIEYVADLDQNILNNGVTERSLNGILYNQLTCAGMALTFKEMMDRLGIECYYQNQMHKHAFNVVKLDGKLRGIDVTWDCTKTEDEKCSFANFGQDPNFYSRTGHFVDKNPYKGRYRVIDAEETLFDLTVFTKQEIAENYSVIEDAIESRTPINRSFRSFDKDGKRKFLPVDNFVEELKEERAIITKLKLLNQIGKMPEEVGEMIEATKRRYGFISDYIGNQHGVMSSSSLLEEIAKLNGLNGKLIVQDGKMLFSGYSQERGMIEGEVLPEEQYQQICTTLFEDITKYYTQYFVNGASQIDDILATYTMLENVPSEVAGKTATLRTQLFTKIKLFANGDNFFEKIGIPKEDIEFVSSKAKVFLDRSREESDVEIGIARHESDLDFLGAIIQNDIIDVLLSGREYSEEDFSKLMDDVRTNWTDSEFSDEEFRILLNEALNKTINPAQVSKDTVRAEISKQEINGVIQEIRQTQTKDLQQTKVK